MATEAKGRRPYRRKKPEYEHFKNLVLETRRKLFYVSTTGEATSYDKFSKTETKLKKSMHGGQIRVAIKGLKNPSLKRLVWQIAHGRISDQWHVQCIDGDETNCDIRNLRLISKRQAGQLSGPLSRSKAVIVSAFGRDKRYRSVREAAKALYCSYQTLLDYLSKKVKNSALKKRGRKIYYASNKEEKPCLNTGRKPKSESQPAQVANR